MVKLIIAWNMSCTSIPSIPSSRDVNNVICIRGFSVNLSLNAQLACRQVGGWRIALVYCQIYSIILCTVNPWQNACQLLW